MSGIVTADAATGWPRYWSCRHPAATASPRLASAWDQERNLSGTPVVAVEPVRGLKAFEPSAGATGLEGHYLSVARRGACGLVVREIAPW